MQASHYHWRRYQLVHLSKHPHLPDVPSLPTNHRTNLKIWWRWIEYLHMCRICIIRHTMGMTARSCASSRALVCAHVVCLFLLTTTLCVRERECWCVYVRHMHAYTPMHISSMCIYRVKRPIEFLCSHGRKCNTTNTNMHTFAGPYRPCIIKRAQNHIKRVLLSSNRALYCLLKRNTRHGPYVHYTYMHMWPYSILHPFIRTHM